MGTEATSGGVESIVSPGDCAVDDLPKWSVAVNKVNANTRSASWEPVFMNAEVDSHHTSICYSQVRVSHPRCSY